MIKPGTVVLACRFAYFEFKRVLWMNSGALENWDSIEAIPEGVDSEEEISKERGGIFHRRDSVIYHAYYNSFTKKAFASASEAAKQMRLIAMYIED